ncbi:T-cell surface glycoprotein CD3 epsilon chain [Amia ocellicauda]|uniref:T-cell surface glycoprotein CD3 epsilon chain n=1 Tax=Amia ocellicauda TaxID=2972642 RepID=UPI00346423A5
MNKVILCLFLTITVDHCVSDTVGSIEVSGTTVTLNCDYDTPQWGKVKGEFDPKHTTSKFLSISNYSDESVLYYCYEHEDRKTYFYFKGKVCENCYEVEIPMLAGVIVIDLLVTMGVVILVYYCSQKKGGASPLAPASRPGRNDRAPPVPNPDYEPLRTGTHDLYSGLHKN